MTNVCVLLSTYNGANYLREQLESICSQTGVSVYMVVRDDGSTDNTVDILKDFDDQFSGMDIIRGDNIGAKMSFYNLALYALNNEQQFDYYAFCDQDDIWYKDKLYRAICDLEQSNNPDKMWGGRGRAVDVHMKPLNAPGVVIGRDLVSSIVSSRIQGCTQVFSYGLLKKMMTISSLFGEKEKYLIPWHDGWLTLVAFATRAFVCICDVPCLDYRQHIGNEVGIAQSYGRLLKRRFHHFISSPREKSAKCQTLLLVLESELAPEDKQIVKKIAFYRKSIVAWISLLMDKSLYVYDWRTNIGTFVTVLLRLF